MARSRRQARLRAPNSPPQGAKKTPSCTWAWHLAIREQVATNRPAGIAEVHQKLSARLGDTHEAEHAMLEPFAETLWEARSGRDVCRMSRFTLGAPAEAAKAG